MRARMQESRGSPPSARGIPAAAVRPDGLAGITPERAGNTSPSTRPASSSTDHPRARGEYAGVWRGVVSSVGSPPSARGIRVTPVGPDLVDRITPERAGNTLAVYGVDGEPGGSPPSARGIPTSTFLDPIREGITPERAGNTGEFWD